MSEETPATEPTATAPPAAWASTRQPRAAVAAGRLPTRVSKARAWRASPQRMAVASSYARWQVG